MNKPFFVYLAGPEVFLKNAPEILAEKIKICQQMGWIGLSPVDNELPEEGLMGEALAGAIFTGNVEMMDKADAVIANITPFRGPHMDPGTAFEIGYFSAKNKPIMVYTQHSDQLVNRVVDWSVKITQEGHELRDRNNHLVENFGLKENLMIDSSIDGLGIDADVVVSPPIFGKQVLECSQGFQEAARRLYHLTEIARTFKTQSPRRPGRP